MNLDVLWYLVFIAAMICYAILDGFDLGVGILHLFSKKDSERRVQLNAIGPVWDGNEVWLVIVGGALFAGFPEVYATLCSGAYALVMILLAALIFRAVAIEFRSKIEAPNWRALWDGVFSVASFGVAFGVGLVLGNLVEGIPLDENRDFVGDFFTFLRPYGLLVGITTVALFTMHGSIYLVMKTEGAFHEVLRGRVRYTILLFVFCYGITTLASLRFMPHMFEVFSAYPWLWAVPLGALLCILNVPLQMKRRNDGWAFISSSLSIALLLSLFALGTFPTLVRSSLDPENNSLTLFNAASSQLTMKVLLSIVGIGLPLVFAYGYYIYRVFRGKVKLDSHSY